MKFNNLILLGSFLLLVLLLGIGVATANENNTIESVEIDVGKDLSDLNGSVNSNDSAEEYNAVIIAKNSTQKYNGDNEVAVKIVDNNNKIINNAKVCINDRITPTYDDEGIYYFYFDLNPGDHNLKITLDDSHHKAKPVFINLKIVKSKFTGKIKCKSYWGVSNSKFTMRATVYNDDLSYYENGYVTFKINGKSYMVKTKNGVATKTIRIKKAGTFTYTAKFTNDKYSSSVIGKGKFYVLNTAKKARIFKIKGYKTVIPINKFKKLVNAKNSGKTLIYKVKTNKEIKQTVEKISYSYKWKYVKTVDLVYAHEKTYYNSNYKYDTIKRHWIDDGVYYETCKLYKKVEVKKVSYKKVKSRVYAWFGYALNGQVGHDKYWVEIMTDNGGVVKGKLHWEVKSSTLTGLKTAKPKDKKNFVMI